MEIIIRDTGVSNEGRLAILFIDIMKFAITMFADFVQLTEF
jgi:hypothetical protein